MLNFNDRQWLEYTIMHPFEGFENMRWKKSGSLKIAFIIVGLFFFGEIVHDKLYSFQFVAEYDEIFNINPFRNSDYKSSMKYAKLADDSELYNKAFEEYRTIFLKENVSKIFVVAVIITIFIFRKKM